MRSGCGVKCSTVWQYTTSKLRSGNSSASPSMTCERARRGPAAEVRAGEIDRARRDIDAGHDGTAAREAREIVAEATADVEHGLAGIAGEVDALRQIAQLLEAVGLHLLEELPRSRRMAGDLPVGDVLVPVRRAPRP